MPLRFVDLDSRKSEHRDFIIRKRSPSLREVFVVCTAIIVAGLCPIYLTQDTVALASLLFTINGAACLYALVNVNRNRELLAVTEFENALFASAMGKGSRFCLIVGKSGAISYSNMAFNELFSMAKDGSSIEDWLCAGNVSADEKARLHDAIARGGDKRVDLAIDTNANERLLPYAFDRTDSPPERLRALARPGSMNSANDSSFVSVESSRCGSPLGGFTLMSLRWV
jgi:two-component system, cell cycle sensor histidine kinase and response regulator CckA